MLQTIRFVFRNDDIYKRGIILTLRVARMYSLFLKTMFQLCVIVIAIALHASKSY